MTPDQLKQLRKQTGLTITKAAACVHITSRSWQRYESGERKIPDGIVELFCIKNKIPYPTEVEDA